MFNVELLVFVIFLSLIHILFTLLISNKNYKYYLVHVCFNTFIVYQCIDISIPTILNPYQVYILDNHNISYYVITFHIYHMLLYYVNTDELIHHILMNGIVLPLSWFYFTNIVITAIVITTGCFGGAIYLLLVLKYFEFIQKNTMLYLSYIINIWLRSPACVIIAYIIFINYYDKELLLCVPAIICSLACFWNGIYFSYTSGKSYYKSLNTFNV